MVLAQHDLQKHNPDHTKFTLSEVNKGITKNSNSSCSATSCL